MVTIWITSYRWSSEFSNVSTGSPHTSWQLTFSQTLAKVKHFLSSLPFTPPSYPFTPFQSFTPHASLSLSSVTQLLACLLPHSLMGGAMWMACRAATPHSAGVSLSCPSVPRSARQRPSSEPRGPLAPVANMHVSSCSDIKDTICPWCH